MFINSLTEKSIQPFQLYFKFHLMSLKNDFINVFPLAGSLPNNLIPHNQSGTYEAYDSIYLKCSESSWRFTQRMLPPPPQYISRVRTKNKNLKQGNIQYSIPVDFLLFFFSFLLSFFFWFSFTPTFFLFLFLSFFFFSFRTKTNSTGEQCK